MNNKGRKTTIVAYVMAILGLSVFLMWYLTKIQTAELMLAFLAINYFGNMFTSYLAKDQTASHTFDLKADDIGGGGIKNPKP